MFPNSLEEQVWTYEIIWWPSLQRYGTFLPMYDTNIDRKWAKKWRGREYSYHDLNPWIQIPSYFSSVQSLSRLRLFATPWIAAARPPCQSQTPGVHSDSRPSSPWYHPAISSSVVPFSSCPQSLPASESFPMSQLFTWGGQSTGASALASFLPKKSLVTRSINFFDCLSQVDWISMSCNQKSWLIYLTHEKLRGGY